MANTIEFTINSALLKKHIKVLKGVISQNPIVPILENLLFNCTFPSDQKDEPVWDNTLYALRLSASDLQTTITVEQPIKYVSGAGLPMFCINANKLYKLLSKLPDQELTFTFDGENKVKVITQQRTGTYSFYAENATDFPKLPTLADNHEKLTAQSSLLRRALIANYACTSNDDLRPAYTGVYFDTDALVSTDGHRLMLIQDSSVQSTETPFIVPAKTCRVLIDALKGKELTVNIDVAVAPKTPSIGSSRVGGNVRFSFDNVTIIARLIDERFPDYMNALPGKHLTEVVVNRLGLLRLVERINVFANPATHQIRMSIQQNKLVISDEYREADDEGQEEINATVDLHAPIEIGFNASLFAETLKILPETHVQLLITAPNRAVVLHPHDGEPNPDILALIMPVMLNTYA